MSRIGLTKNGLVFSLFALSGLILATLACSFDVGGIRGVEKTLVGVVETQTGFEIQIGDAQNGEEETGVSQPEQEPTPIPNSEQEEIPHPDVVYEGISFYFNPDIFGGVNSLMIEGQNLGEDFMPGDTYPTHFEFTWDSYAVENSSFMPQILIYPISEYRAISSYASGTIEDLKTTLANRPGGSPLQNLPFLPMWNAAQLFAAKVEYFDFQNGSGVRFLTMYGQDIYPLDNTNIFYTYQGLTHDEKYYISAIFPVTHAQLPETGDIILENYDNFYENWDTYLADTLQMLEEQAGDSFFPSLNLLDATVKSIQIDR